MNTKNSRDRDEAVEFQEIIKASLDGVELDGAKVFVENAEPCGLKGSLSLDIGVKDGSRKEHLLSLAAFPGMEPHYRPWLEIFCIRERPFGKAFFNSTLEASLMEALCRTLGRGGKVYVEYYSDRETACGLTMDFPPAATRQGYELFNLGFTWFKDWYFSEGGHEGGQKLQGEKPLNESSKVKHFRRLRKEVEAFLVRSEYEELKGEMEVFLIRARKRAEQILEKIDSYFDSSGLG